MSGYYYTVNASVNKSLHHLLTLKQSNATCGKKKKTEQRDYFTIPAEAFFVSIDM